MLGVLVAGTTKGAMLAGCGASGVVGTFRISPGRCDGTTVAGSCLRIVKPGGSAAAGPFVSNQQSPCRQRSYTVVRPGADGGLTAGSFRPKPTPVFDAAGDPRANGIIMPVTFDGGRFAISTNPVDPQTDAHLSAPVIHELNGKLPGQLEAWSAAWTRQYFDEGSPRPGGGLYTAVSGTYDAKTGAYSLAWFSQTLGHPFNGFTVYWYVVGQFIPKK